MEVESSQFVSSFCSSATSSPPSLTNSTPVSFSSIQKFISSSVLLVAHPHQLTNHHHPKPSNRPSLLHLLLFTRGNLAPYRIGPEFDRT